MLLTIIIICALMYAGALIATSRDVEYDDLIEPLERAKDQVYKWKNPSSSESSETEEDSTQPRAD